MTDTTDNTQYSGKENDNFPNRIDENIMKLVKLTDNKYVTTGVEFKPLGIGRKAQYFTIDVVSTFAFWEVIRESPDGFG